MQTVGTVSNTSVVTKAKRPDYALASFRLIFLFFILISFIKVFLFFILFYDFLFVFLFQCKYMHYTGELWNLLEQKYKTDLETGGGGGNKAGDCEFITAPTPSVTVRIGSWELHAGQCGVCQAAESWRQRADFRKGKASWWRRRTWEGSDTVLRDTWLPAGCDCGSTRTGRGSAVGGRQQGSGLPALGKLHLSVPAQR